MLCCIWSLDQSETKWMRLVRFVSHGVVIFPNQWISSNRSGGADGMTAIPFENTTNTRCHWKERHAAIVLHALANHHCSNRPSPFITLALSHMDPDWYKVQRLPGEVALWPSDDGSAPKVTWGTTGGCSLHGRSAPRGYEICSTGLVAGRPRPTFAGFGTSLWPLFVWIKI
jgi:hypothetical protein